MAANKKKPLYTFTPPQQNYLLQANPWSGLMNQAEMAPPAAAPQEAAPTQESINQASEIGQMAQQLPTGMQPGVAADPRRDKWNAEAKLQDTIKNIVAANTYMGPEQANALMGMVKDLPIMKEREESRARERELQREVLSSLPTGVDVSPLMALTDAWTGSNLAKSYKAPPGWDARAKLLLDYGQKMQKDEQDQLDSMIKMAQYMKSGSTTEQLGSVLGQSYSMGQTPLGQPKLGGAGRPRDPQIEDKYLISMANKAYDKFSEANRQLNTLEDNLARGDLQGLQISLGFASRQLGGQMGVLTDKDVRQTLPATGLQTLAQLEAYVTNNPNVLLDPKITKGLKELAAIARTKLESKYTDDLGKLRNAVSASSLKGREPILDAYKLTPKAPEAAEKKAPSLKDMFQKLMEKEK